MFLFWFSSVSGCADNINLICAEMWEWHTKVSGDPLTTKKKGHSQDHFFECGACTEHDAVSLIFLASKQIRPRAKFHRQMFWVASLRLIRSKTEK